MILEIRVTVQNTDAFNPLSRSRACQLAASHAFTSEAVLYELLARIRPEYMMIISSHCLSCAVISNDKEEIRLPSSHLLDE